MPQVHSIDIANLNFTLMNWNEKEGNFESRVKKGMKLRLAICVDYEVLWNFCSWLVDVKYECKKFIVLTYIPPFNIL